ncbi:hypothetical protein MMC28_010541 [Mycoblastus sanguinarius]|nr:hypothetical protein [Mycoblastus sanguinarius]
MDPPASQAIQTIRIDPLIYQPLGPRPKQIRLLRLHPGAGLEDIECHLDHVSLEDNPGFAALSYVWGDLTETRTIRLQGVTFTITKSLHDALRSIRSHLPNMSTLWVDALCVNQQDLAERSRQVRQMQFIYSHAKHTIIWFGPGDELSRGAIRLMIEMNKTLKLDEPLFNTFPMMAGFPRDTITSHPMTLLLDQLDAWEALAYMIHRPWWARVWIAQEIKLSKDPILLWGENALG